MPTSRVLPIDWARYTLKEDVVVREVSSLTPFKFAWLDIPRIAPEEFELLVDSIQSNGVYEPLTITPKGEVVDGQARLRAAKRIGLHEVPTRVLDGGDADDYAIWAAAVNVGRRHLTPSQRFALVKAMLAMLEVRAQERQEATRFGRNGRESTCGDASPARPNVDAPAESSDVRTRIAALVGVSRSQAAKIVNLVKHGSAETHAALAAGRTSIHRAHAALGAASSNGTCADWPPRGATPPPLGTDPIATLRLVAALISDWVQAADAWDADKRSDFVRALQTVVDSCDMAFRRLLPPIRSERA